MVKNKELLREFREFIKSQNIDYFIVNSTDEYLNEYNKLENNSRFLLTNFSGSTGDVIVSADKLFLFVDGRYHYQAEIETDPDIVTLIKLDISKSPQKALYEKLAELCVDKSRIGIVSSKTSCVGYKELLKNLENKSSVEIIEYVNDPLSSLIKFREDTDVVEELRKVPHEISGKISLDKLLELKAFNEENNIDFLLISDLSNIAYITNLRGKEIPYSSSFKAKAVFFRNNLYVFTDYSRVPEKILKSYPENIIFKHESEFIQVINELNPDNVYYHPASTPLSVFRKIEFLSEKVIEIKESFVSTLKSIKNSEELKYLRQCYVKTDIVFNRAICWLDQEIEHGNEISEKDLSDKFKQLFSEEGAYDLSFEPITASGQNSAFIHYTNPDPNKIIKSGELVLNDCGAYFDGGYATDQTRTILAGGTKAQATDLQKKLYTSVLKGFLTGINFDISDRKTGYDLDKAVRDVLEECKPEGFNFSHATGHGVGISVHESPPRVGPSEFSKSPFEAGMVFTIEPGLYRDDFGGVRIENTVMAVEIDGLLTIKTLTRAALDENLIDYDMLTEAEKNWLIKYNKSKIG